MRTMIFVFVAAGGISWALAIATFVLHARKYDDLSDTRVDDRLVGKEKAGARASKGSGS